MITLYEIRALRRTSIAQWDDEAVKTHRDPVQALAHFTALMRHPFDGAEDADMKLVLMRMEIGGEICVAALLRVARTDFGPWKEEDVFGRPA